MAYMTKHRRIDSSNSSTLLLPEIGQFLEIDHDLDQFNNELRNVDNRTSDARLNELVEKLNTWINDKVLIQFINAYLFRLNGFQTYTRMTADNVNTLDIYKSVETGLMRDIWSEIKVSNYKIGRDYQGEEYKSYVVLTESKTYSDFSEQERTPYKKLFDILERAVWLPTGKTDKEYGFATGFYLCVKRINSSADIGKRLTLSQAGDILSAVGKFKYLNPILYIINAELEGRVTIERIVDVARPVINTDGTPTSEISSRASDRNIINSKLVDFTYKDIFFRRYDSEWETLCERFMRYVLYVSETLLGIGSNATNSLGRNAVIQHLNKIRELLFYVISYTNSVKHIPNDLGTITFPNTIFKKVDYRSETKKYPGNRDKIPNLFTEVTGLERGNVATVGSFMQYLFTELSLKIINLARYNPATPISKFLKNAEFDKKICNIPCFGITNEGQVLLAPFGSETIPNPFIALNGNIGHSYSDGEIVATWLDLRMGENGFIGSFSGYFGRYFNLPKTGFEFSIGLTGCLDAFISLGESIFKEGVSSKYNDLPDLESYLKDRNFIEKFRRKYGTNPTRYHFIPISIVELIIRYIVGSVKTSIITRLRYEPLPEKLLNALNKDVYTNFPLGTKFLYVSLYTDDRFNSTTSNAENHGRRLSDLVDIYVNRGYSNKWGVTDSEILKAIKRLERIDDSIVLNKESLDIMIDVIYKVIINYISAPSREDTFRLSVNKDLSPESSYKDRDIKRHILLPLLDDMRKNSDFS